MLQRAWNGGSQVQNGMLNGFMRSMAKPLEVATAVSPTLKGQDIEGINLPYLFK